MANRVRRQPSGAQLQCLQDAILYAYDFEALKQMVRLELEENLLNLVAFVDQGLKGMAHDLVIEYASRPGGLHQLVAAARAGNPANDELADVAEELLAIEFDPLPAPEPPRVAGDQISANISDDARYVNVGKNIRQVIHQLGR